MDERLEVSLVSSWLGPFFLKQFGETVLPHQRKGRRTPKRRGLSLDLHNFVRWPEAPQQIVRNSNGLERAPCRLLHFAKFRLTVHGDAISIGVSIEMK